MTVSNANEIMLSNKNPIVPNKDKPLAFLEISGIKIECLHKVEIRERLSFIWEDITDMAIYEY